MFMPSSFDSISHFVVCKYVSLALLSNVFTSCQLFFFSLVLNIVQTGIAMCILSPCISARISGTGYWCLAKMVYSSFLDKKNCKRELES